MSFILLHFCFHSLYILPLFCFTSTHILPFFCFTSTHILPRICFTSPHILPLICFSALHILTLLFFSFPTSCSSLSSPHINILLFYCFCFSPQPAPSHHWTAPHTTGLPLISRLRTDQVHNCPVILPNNPLMSLHSLSGSSIPPPCSLSPPLLLIPVRWISPISPSKHLDGFDDNCMYIGLQWWHAHVF